MRGYIYFSYLHKCYRVQESARYAQGIRLPDGTVVAPAYWVETNTPVPVDLHPVHGFLVFIERADECELA